MAAALLINGVDAGSYGLTLAEAPGWLDAPPRQTPSSPIIGRGGAKKLAPPVEQPRRLTLRGMVRSTTVAGARTNIDALKLALLADSLALTFADHTDRVIYATLESFTAPPPVGSFVQENLPVEAVLTAYDPLSYDAALAGVLQWYSPGDTITGESFTRSTTAYQIGAGGTLNQQAINVKRDSHWVNSNRHILLEDARTNPILWSNDFSNAVWTKTTMTVGTGIAGPDGGTTACTLTATGASANVTQFPANAANIVRANKMWIRRRTGTGIIQMMNPTGSGWTTVAVGSAWASFSVVGSASATRGQGILIATSGDAVDVWCAQNEDGAFSSSEIPTTTVAVTRGADSYSLPFTTPPQEATFYAKFVEAGTAVAGARLFEITNAADAAPSFIGYSPAGAYRAYHTNAVAAVFSTLAASPAIGDTVEFQGRLFGDGSVDATQSLNAAAATVAAQSAANAFATAWAGQLLWLNSASATTGIGFTALQSFKIVAGARSLTEMRAIPRMPLGTGPIRPLVTINGASTNPVITLYNKAGVAVASLTLTLTTVGGDVLVIDMDAKTVKKNGASVLSAITAGDFFSIDPADQANFGAPGPRIDSSSGATSVAYYKSWR